MKKQAGVPEIGIYWEYKGEIIAFTMPSDQMHPGVTGFTDSPYDHIATWEDVGKMYPELKRKEYDEVPRGRVVGMPGLGSFKLFIPPEKAKDKVFISKVMREFNLPPTKTKVETDEHYRTDTSGFSNWMSDPFDDDYEPDMSDEWDDELV